MRARNAREIACNRASQNVYAYSRSTTYERTRRLQAVFLIAYDNNGNVSALCTYAMHVIVQFILGLRSGFGELQ